ncbi:purine-cytosine permease family protein [Actinospica sp.]|jgi:NCS1 nucleoside transporter family|uniref:purine-cytosine permease family protein n=1 Tax=Actinospica sp. TaxID=1872142 RepID=UPI002C632A86|nr:cytosine permease [Actinospica sp.]HWG27515.1 cytosine permease [Actinospica sp.]
MTSTEAQAAHIPEVREGDYGTKVAAVEPGGAEFIPLDERHGRPLNLFWTWTSPNFEFATVFVGALPLLFFGESFTQAALAIILGTGLGSLAMAALSARGPEHGVPQMILSRVSFGRFGNILPAGINALVAGVGWFAVNSVSGTLALSALTGWAEVPCLLLITVAQIAIAFFGHNLVHVFERLAFPLLALVFTAVSVILLAESHPSAAGGGGGMGGFLLTLGATFGYAAGWNPYAADYTRYLKRDVNKRAVGLWAGLGVFVSCVLLELAGTAAATLTVPNGLWDADPTQAFITHITPWLGDVTLVCIAIGAVCANALNVYSGAMSFMALGIKIPLTARRALVALVFGVAGFFLAWSGLSDAGTKYNNFLLVIAYWIGPWLGVYFTDQLLRRGQDVDGLLFSKSHKPVAGVLAMAAAMAVSIPLFSAQTDFAGYLAKRHPSLGDLTFEVGFVLAALFYWLLFSYLPRSLGRGDATQSSVG